MRRKGADIVFLQETHLREGSLPTLQNRYYPVVYHSKYKEAKSRGVSILISARIPWTHTDVKLDREGRSLLLKGRIGDVKITLANLYVPNTHQDTFLKRQLDLLLQFSDGQLIIGGDLNIPLTPTEDTSTGMSSTSRDLRKRISATLHSLQLIDVWRLSCREERLHLLQITSVIFYFLIPHRHLQAIKETTIGSITWSDHAPITLRYALTPCGLRPPWRLNEGLLKDPVVLAEVTKEIGHYFASNDTPDCDTGLVWEAHKAVIRGILIKHGSRIKQQRTAQLETLLKTLESLETCHKQTPTRQLDLLQYKAKSGTTDYAKENI